MSAPQEEDTSTNPNAPKVLRIGIIQGGKIIEERRLKRRETVSVGSTPKSTFVVNAASVPKAWDMFELVGNDYWLRFGDDMDGRVQSGESAVTDFATLRKNPDTQKRGGAFVVKLNDESRGKVMMGEVTVLFQFVAPPAPPSKPVLPSDVRGSLLSNIDVQFTSIFAATAVFMIAFASYARSVPYVEPSTIEQLSDRYIKMIMPDRIPEPAKTAEGEGDKGKEKAKEDEKDKGKDKGPEKGQKTGKKKEGPVDAEAAARAKKEALTKAVAGKGLLGVIGTTRGGKDSAISDVFADGGGAFDGKLGDAFSGIQGVEIAESGGERATRGGGSGESVGVGSLGTSGGGNVSVGGKGEEQAVKGAIVAETPEVEGELSRDAINAVMKRQLTALKDCYERQLKRTPTLAGKIVLDFEILDTGKISDVKFSEDTVRNAAVKECIVQRSKFWRFPKPEGGSVLVSFPLVFTPSSG